jgi:oxygen-independent coproporphyrinogen-3 oxidase
MDTTIVAAYDRPVPRYTSYPTANHFTPAVGPAEHAAWLGALGRRSTALYVHVPFCRRLCWYCACHTVAMRHEGTLASYAGALEAELDLVTRSAADLVVGSIQWGGGTPSQLGASRLLSVGRRIAALFDRDTGAEVSMEVDPRFCDEALVEAMAALGVNRASLGVQDFDLGVQRAINRLQSAELTAAALARLRHAGIRQCNIDLVYGLPGQTLETLQHTVEQAIALGPDRFAVFAYAHVPWMKPRQRLIDTAMLPDAILRSAMAELLADRLAAAGYVKIGLDHYARPNDRLARATRSGELRRNFQGYVADRQPWVVGIGASAISCLPQGFSQNVADAGGYMAALGEGRFATGRGIVLSADDRLRGGIIGRLMCDYAADLSGFCQALGVAPETLLQSHPALAALSDDGLVVLDGARLQVTERGRPLVRSVCSAFDRYYTGAEGRHARGI